MINLTIKKEFRFTSYLLNFVILIILVSCMKPNVDRNIPFNWVAEILEIDVSGNQKTILAYYQDFGAGAGDDGIFGSGDDGILYYTKFIDNSMKGSPTIKYTENGKDNLWFTLDDVKDNQSISIKSYIKDDKRIRVSSIGTDEILGSDDDVLSGYEKIVINGNLTRYINYVDAGGDEIWFTGDDVIGVYENKISELFSGYVQSSQYFYSQTAELFSYSHYTISIENENEKTILTSDYYSIGKDKIWLTDDDEVILHEEYINENGLLIEKIKTGGVGNDNILLTADDEKFSYFKLLYNSENELVKIMRAVSFGNDGVINTGDEIWETILDIEFDRSNPNISLIKVVILDEVYALKYEKNNMEKDLKVSLKISEIDSFLSYMTSSHAFKIRSSAYNYTESNIFSVENGHLSYSKNFRYDRYNYPEDISIDPYIYVSGVEVIKSKAKNNSIMDIFDIDYGIRSETINKSFEVLFGTPAEDYIDYNENKEYSIEFEKIDEYSSREITQNYNIYSTNNYLANKSTKILIDRRVLKN